MPRPQPPSPGNNQPDFLHLNPCLTIGDGGIPPVAKQMPQTKSKPSGIGLVIAIIIAIILFFLTLIGVLTGQSQDQDKKKKEPANLFRGDDNYRIGDSLGYKIGSSEAAAAEIQTPWEHVKFHTRGQTSRFTSFSESYEKANSFSKKGRVWKVSRKQLLRLMEGTTPSIIIYTAEDVRDLMEANEDKKVKDQAKNIYNQMKQNQEVLIEGQIPGGFLKPAKS